MRFKKMVAHDLAELSLVIVQTLRPLLHLFLKSHAPRRTHYISHEPTQPRARPEPRSYCIRFHCLVYGFPRMSLLIAGCSEVEPSSHGLVNACAAFPSEAHAAHRYAWVNNSATCCEGERAGLR